MNSDQRQAVLDALGAAHDGLDTNELASLLSVHPNTVRWHLGVLADAGLVRSSPEHRRRRGRPSVVFRLTGKGAAHDRDDYHLLATMLTDALAGDRDGDARAYEAGVRWGRHLHEAEGDAGVVELLDRQGFAAERHGDRIEMRRCPFYALAEAAPQVVCTLHHGVIDGALAASGSRALVDRLDPFVEPALCVAHLTSSSS
jgi:predicted ArsR family transcriptional regulator